MEFRNGNILLLSHRRAHRQQEANELRHKLESARLAESAARLQLLERSTDSTPTGTLGSTNSTAVTANGLSNGIAVGMVRGFMSWEEP